MYTASDPGVQLRRDAAYASLKAALVRGEFAVSERLGEERLAIELEVSRTPVREALSRLASEGLVIRHAEGGYAPVVPDLPTIRELYDVRFALERWALGRPTPATATHDQAQLKSLRDDWCNLDAPAHDADVDPDFVLLDESFHVRLARSSGNRSLADQLEGVNARIRVVRVHDFLTADRVARTIEQHLTVVDAALDGDLAAAERHLIGHFDESLAVVEERALVAIGRMVQGRKGRRRR